MYNKSVIPDIVYLRMCLNALFNLGAVNKVYLIASYVLLQYIYTVLGFHDSITEHT